MTVAVSNLRRIAIMAPPPARVGDPASSCPSHVSADEGAVLAEVERADIAAAIWRRTVDAALAAALAALPHDDIDDIEAALPATDTELHAAALLGMAGYPVAVAVALARDIAVLAGRMRGRGLTIRLEWVETDACRRFHADAVTVRLLTTYVGRGTQWKRADQPDAGAHELAAGDVAVFKGRLLAPEAPILHRSPPIGGTGERRLLLVLDEADTA